MKAEKKKNQSSPAGSSTAAFGRRLIRSSAAVPEARSMKKTLCLMSFHAANPAPASDMKSSVLLTAY